MNDYLQVLKTIRSDPKSFQGNHFRNNASAYAEAASRNHITCLMGGKNVGRWHLTQWGMQFLSRMEAL